MADKKTGPASASASRHVQGVTTKKDAVRRAMAALGKDTRPLHLRDHIRKRYGIDMSIDHISTCKGEIVRERSQNKPTGQNPGAGKTLAQPPAGQKPAMTTKAGLAGSSPSQGRLTSQNNAANSSISLRDIETVKDLVERIGAANLKKLIDVMAR
jgi:hypothetical protein